MSNFRKIKKFTNRVFVSRDVLKTSFDIRNCFSSKEKQVCYDGVFYDDIGSDPLIYFNRDMNWLLFGKRTDPDIKPGFQAELEITVKMKMYDSDGRAVEF